ncbi:MAG TPA: hypothetical protein VHE33_20990 [Acidobacteriaceae bacterium]|nr:hypothetical protein [Acidobacteriaceae bacterium]
MLSDSEIRERLGPLNDPAPNPDKNPRGPSAARIVALVVLVLVLWGAGVAVILHLERISPALYDARSGHVYRLSDTRHVAYLTQNQSYVAWGAIGVPAVVTLVVAFLGFRRKKLPLDG